MQPGQRSSRAERTPSRSGRSVWLSRLSAAFLLIGTVAAGAPAAAAGHSATRHHRHHQRARTARAHRQNQRWSATAPCAGADSSATSASMSQMVAAVDCLVNQQRLQFGLPPLQVSSKLDRSAQAWSDSMVANGNFNHANLGGRLSAVGFDWQSGGENIATGYLTPRDVVAGWMASTGHCQNILDPGYREMGTGETASPVGNWASTPATWTQDFGLTFSQSPLSQRSGPQNGCPYTIASSSPGA